MNPNKRDTGPGIEIKPQSVEAAKGTSEKGSEVAANAEASPSKQIGAPSTPVAPIVIPDANPVILPTATQAGSNNAQASMGHSDKDKIEKEWIDRAKAIIEHTRTDPFKQKNEMSKVKAEYIKHRFDKTVQTDLRQ